MFSNKLELCYKSIKRIFCPQISKYLKTNPLQNNPWVKEEIKKKLGILEYFEMNMKMKMQHIKICDMLLKQ